MRTDFKTSWTRQTRKNHAKALDANEILRRHGPDALREQFDRNRRPYITAATESKSIVLRAKQSDWRTKITAASDLQTMAFEQSAIFSQDTFRKARPFSPARALRT